MMHPMMALAIAGIALGAAPAGEKGVDTLRIEWEDNLLRVRSPHIPAGVLELWYLEAFCRRGSTDRDWSATVIPHKSTQLAASDDGTRVRLQSTVEPGVIVTHEIQASADEVDFRLTLTNPSDQAVDIEWAQPCIRVGDFTGLDQETYIQRCFIFTNRGLTTLDQTRRTEEARYRGGQVYVPADISRDDVNPRPLSPDAPVNGLIGCFSADGQLLLAMAWDHTQELFQGIIRCIHADFRIGGLGPRETKHLHGKLYLIENDPRELLKRYRRDFGE